MESREESVIVSGSGKSKDEAFAKAMSLVQKALADKIKGTIIRIEPLAVEFLEGREVTETERFMFLFMKREVSTYTIRIKVRASLAIVDVDSFKFEKAGKKGLAGRLLK